MIAIHGLRTFYNQKTRTYSGELFIREAEAPKEVTFRVLRKHNQAEAWENGKRKLIKHEYWESITQAVDFPKRGTKDWKEKRKAVS